MMFTNLWYISIFMSNFVLWSLYALILKVLVQISSLFMLLPYSRSNDAPSSTVKVMKFICMILFLCIDHWGLVSLIFEVFYRYLYCTLIGRLSAGCVQEVKGPFRCNGGVKSITLNSKKKKSSQVIPNLPSLVPRLSTRIVKQIVPLF